VGGRRALNDASGARERQLDEARHLILDGNARCLEHPRKQADRSEPRKRVDFVDEQFAVFAKEEIDAR